MYVSMYICIHTCIQTTICAAPAVSCATLQPYLDRHIVTPPGLIGCCQQKQGSIIFEK